MKYHHGFYLKVDDFLLTSVFETFRKEPINSFELYPAHFFYQLLAIVRMQ